MRWTSARCRASLGGPIGEVRYNPEYAEWDPSHDELGYEEYPYLDGLGKGPAQCFRYGGFGHLAAQCATPKGAGKGGGKDLRKGGVKGNNGKGKDMKGAGKGKSRIPCSECGKLGHGPDARRAMFHLAGKIFKPCP